MPEVQLAPEIVPKLLLPDASFKVVPEPSSKLYAAIRLLSGELATFTLIAELVAVFPAVSLAVAVIECVPLAMLLESHDIEYGDDVSSLPTFAPSILNCTPATPMLSEAVAYKVIVPDTVPGNGEDIDTLGGCVSAADVVKVKSLEVERFPATFLDFTLKWYKVNGESPPIETECAVTRLLFNTVELPYPDVRPKSTCESLKSSVAHVIVELFGVGLEFTAEISEGVVSVV
jgi:hypothetical protein